MSRIHVHRISRAAMMRRGVIVSAAALALVLAGPAGSAAASPAAPATPTPLATWSAPIVWDGSEFVTVAADEQGDLLLWSEPAGGTTWAKKQIYTNSTGNPMIEPALATDGEDDLGIVAWNESTGRLASWVGTPGEPFARAALPAADPGSEPSIAYSATGTNWVVSDTVGGNVEFWYSSTFEGGWTPQRVASGASIDFTQAVVTLTDKGAVVVATNGNGIMAAYYQPYFASGWTRPSIFIGYEFRSLSAASSGSQAFVAADDINTNTKVAQVDVITYSDTGSLVRTTGTPYSTAAGLWGTGIAWSGDNVVVVSYTANGEGSINFFYSDSSFAFHRQTVASSTTSLPYSGYPEVVVASGVVHVTDEDQNGSLYDFVQTVGHPVWTPHTIYTG